MTTAYREFNLGDEGIKYIRKCLINGKTLANYLIRTCNLERGKLITFLPTDTNEEAVKQFTTGGKLKEEGLKEEIIKPEGSKLTKVPTPNTDLWLVSIIRSFLTTDVKRLCIFENALAKPSDPWLSSKKMPVFTFHEEVYHFLLGTDAENEKIGETIRIATSHLFIGVMTSVPQETGFSLGGGEITSQELIGFAEKTEKIIVGAYDGEGYLIWRRA
jgi:hypothetical protein